MRSYVDVAWLWLWWIRVYLFVFVAGLGDIFVMYRYAVTGSFDLECDR